jgi:glutamate/tyrosine decarboxylase-like PLP-dependent enzyme
MRKGDSLDQFFLGPKSELRTFLKEVLELVVDDYIFWRRNFHPKDPPAIPYRLLQSEAAEEYRGRFHQELFELISDLKLDVPFFSPRYMAHMVSEVAMPGLVAYLATMLYNPNNVSLEASAVTVDFELEVGRQFAVLFGYDPEQSFGHLCSGGTIANYESLWFHQAGRFLPMAISLACRHEDLPAPKGLPQDVWGLLNVPMERARELHHDFLRETAGRGINGPQLLREHSLSAYGDADYRQLVQETFGATYSTPVVLVPQTAHYSWIRSAGLLGYGRRNLLSVRVDAGFRMDPEDYGRRLQQCLEEKRPVLQSVFLLGTTEFGSVDPIPALLAQRDRFREQGLDSPVHVDAAYGGYFATIFRRGRDQAPPDDPGLRPLREACSALGRTDSTTVDPHKMGYSPYGAGAIVIRHGFLRHLVAEGAHYALDTRGLPHEDLGKFILEGSKPGAAAAAVWFNHRMMPLDLDGYGAHLLDLCRQAQDFHRHALHHDTRLQRREAPFRLMPLTEPETNIVCLLVVPTEARSLAEVDRLNGLCARRFGVRNVESVQEYDYLVSKTRLAADQAFVSEHPLLDGLERNSPSITCLRLVFMNRWVTGETAEGRSYMEDFLESVVEYATEQLAKPALTAPAQASETLRKIGGG